MELKIAISLIEKGIQPDASQRWADLGSGKGLFTTALSKLIGAGSEIYAIDKDGSALKQVAGASHVTINTIKADFINGVDGISELDGILMANSLHFVRDKVVLLKMLSTHLKKNGRFIIIEYDTDKSNMWVPYPISSKKLTDLVQVNNLGVTEKIGATDSAYQSSGMYSMMINLN